MENKQFVAGFGSVGSSTAAQILEEKLQLESENDRYKLMKTIHLLFSALKALEKSKSSMHKRTFYYFYSILDQDFRSKLRDVKGWLNFDTYTYFENVVKTRLKIFRRKNKIK